MMLIESLPMEEVVEAEIRADHAGERCRENSLW
jgi:hypothetical protein